VISFGASGHGLNPMHAAAGHADGADDVFLAGVFGDLAIQHDQGILVGANQSSCHCRSTRSSAKGSSATKARWKELSEGTS